MIEDVYPLSPLQEGLYFNWLTSRGSSVYVSQMSYQLKGQLDVAVLEKSYQVLVARHAILRTFFTEEIGEQPLQVVRKDTPAVFVYKELAGTGISVEEYKEHDRLKGFNLNAGSQMRLSVLSLGGDEYEFVWSYHHIITDGWCMNILIREFTHIYQSLVQGKTPQLNKVVPYSKYIAWLMKKDKERSLQHWKKYLSGYDTMSSLPHTHVNANTNFDQRETFFELDAATSHLIKMLCKESGVTEYTFIQAVWGILLGRYNNTTDVVFGSTVSGRPPEVEGIEEMIGLFINTLPVRVNYSENTTVRELLKEVQQRAIEGIDHHYTQLAHIQSVSELEGNMFDHLVQFQNIPGQETGKYNEEAENNNELSLLSSSASGLNTFNFTCLVVPGKTIGFKFKYNANYFDEGIMAQLQSHLKTLVGNILVNPSLPVGKLEYVSAAEKQQLTSGINRSSIDYPRDKTIVHLFEEQVARTPEAVALVFGSRKVTYRQLHEQSNQLANYLRSSYGVRTNDLVGIMVDRSENMIIAMMGILKSGAAYVAIDTEYPRARKEAIIKETGFKAIVTQTDYIFDLDYYSGNLFAIDIQLDGIDASKVAPTIICKPQDLAYVVFTSGSTGRPKGVMITHQSLVDYSAGITSRTNIRECKTFGLVSTIAADLGNTVIYTSLVQGASLQVFSAADVMSAESMADASIDCLKIVPSHWKALQKKNRLFAPAKCLVFGGEQLTKDVLALLKAGNATCRVFNHYGPSETTIGKLTREIDIQDIDTQISLGKPFGNTTIYIVDKQNAVVPVGVAGEICIGGDGLAAGYLDNPVLTAEKFVSDPFKQVLAIYKTGDLGRWLPDGTVEFLGRTDDQVKIRGFRIEPGEVTNAILSHPGVESAIVLAKADAAGDKRLIAYIAGSNLPDVELIETHLKQLLPHFMLPAQYIQLDAMPLNANGKIDRKKLPDPSGAGFKNAAEYVAPRNEVEEKLVTIWQEILDKQQVGVKDNFFTLGGHSLKVVQLISRINSVFMVKIDIQNIFKDPTIESIAEQISFTIDQHKQKLQAARRVAVEI